MTYPTYGTGTVNAVATGATVINFSGAPQLLTNAAEADGLSISGFGEITILAINSDTQIACRPWPFGAVPAGAAYAIIQDGASRSSRTALANGVTRLVSALNTNGFYIFVPASLSAPDPSLGDEGQFARQPSTRKEWQRIGGVWSFLGIFDKNTVGVDGTVAAPAFSFTSDVGTGIYRIGAGNIGIASAGAKVVDISGTGVAVVGALSSSGNVAVNTNKFTVAAASGNTAIAGTLTVAAAAALSGVVTFGSGGNILNYSVPGSGFWYASSTVAQRWFVGSNVGTDDFRIFAAGWGGNAFSVNGATGAIAIGATLNVASGAVSTSSTTGALVVAGGIGLGGSITAASNISAAGNISGANISAAGNVAGAGLGIGVGYGTIAAGINAISGSNAGQYTVAVQNSHGASGDAVLLVAGGSNTNTDATTVLVDFRRSDFGAIMGTITRNGTSAVAYNTSSDERGKPNRELLSRDYARAIVDRLKIWDFRQGRKHHSRHRRDRTGGICGPQIAGASGFKTGNLVAG
jgi:hypothetical protein